MQAVVKGTQISAVYIENIGVLKMSEMLLCVEVFLSKWLSVLRNNLPPASTGGQGPWTLEGRNLQLYLWKKPQTSQIQCSRRFMGKPRLSHIIVFLLCPVPIGFFFLFTLKHSENAGKREKRWKMSAILRTILFQCWFVVCICVNTKHATGTGPHIARCLAE